MGIMEKKTLVTVLGFGSYRHLTPTMENHMEKNTERIQGVDRDSSFHCMSHSV